NGAAEAIPAVLGGHVDFTITNPGEAAGQIEAGQLRPLAVMSSERLASFPDVPTMIESGFDVTSGTWRGLAVPKGTPEEVVETLANAFKQATEDQKFIDFMNNAKLEIYYLDAAEYQEFIAQDTELMTGIVEEIQKQQE
ncbi:MAG: tripartite tricarboxylate transporter substrate binding protein, partial [Clostridia bacterium]|nr:tripartite tricarboxylate transporter substrate binding protein [Clostridia bacterium]